MHAISPSSYTSLKWPEIQSILSHPTQSPRKELEQWFKQGRLEAELPEVYTLFGIPQPAVHHPEIDTGLHTMLVVEQAWTISNHDPVIGFAALVHDLGKAVTNPDQWPKHTDHEELGVPLVESLCQRLEVPPEVRHLAVIVCQYHLQCHRALEMRPGSIIQWLDQLDLLHQPKLLDAFITACTADARGRTGFETREYLSGYYLKKIAELTSAMMLDTVQTHQIKLQSAISNVKHHYAPFNNVQSRMMTIRNDNNLTSENTLEISNAC